MKRRIGKKIHMAFDNERIIYSLTDTKEGQQEQAK
jgi:hypothetical protein